MSVKRPSGYRGSIRCYCDKCGRFESYSDWDFDVTVPCGKCSTGTLRASLRAQRAHMLANGWELPKPKGPFVRCTCSGCGERVKSYNHDFSVPLACKCGGTLGISANALKRRIGRENKAAKRATGRCTICKCKLRRGNTGKTCAACGRRARLEATCARAHVAVPKHYLEEF